MGKRNNRGKERKLKRQLELAAETAMLRSNKILVDAANSYDDPLHMMPAFKKYDRNGLNLSMECYRVNDLPKETLDWIFDLTKDNMEKLYMDAGWGWDDKEKYEEMTEDNAWHMVVKDMDNGKNPVATVHFRFDIDEGLAVLYCYEIQLMKEVRRKGLGVFLMKTLELLAFLHRMKKVVLTVFKVNQPARKFFKEKLGYKLDETSPEATVYDAMFDEEGVAIYTYEILSKVIPRRKVKPLSQISYNTSAAAAKS